MVASIRARLVASSLAAMPTCLRQFPSGRRFVRWPDQSIQARLSVPIRGTNRITSGLPVNQACGLLPSCPSLGNNPDRSASQLRGGHFYVVALINHCRVRNTETRGPRSRPQFCLFLKEAFGKVQLGSLRFCVLAQSQKLTVIGLGLRTSTR